MARTNLLFCCLLGIITLFAACNKDDNNDKYHELIRLADLKLQEAIKLAENQPCKPIEEWRIDTLPYRYVPVHPSFEKEYNSLIKEYRELSEQAYKAYKPGKNDPLVYNTTPVELAPHFGLRCKEGKMIVANATDLELTEIDQLLDELFPQVVGYFNDVPCTDASKWSIATILKDCEFIQFPVINTPDSRAFGELATKYSHLYQVKKYRTEMDCPSSNANPAKEVICKDGKATLVY
ncbi:hypothetical protein [Sphingobacterium paucimobilis]|uniref:hypothetical protein n=1 Tax=Sphingobacterium paucimobilis TaxID=1385985 RepID=UPI0003B4C9E0|nr:hypothetical protein [Sphingobacterium paucimobilis]